MYNSLKKKVKKLVKKSIWMKMKINKYLNNNKIHSIWKLVQLLCFIKYYPMINTVSVKPLVIHLKNIKLIFKTLLKLPNKFQLALLKLCNDLAKIGKLLVIQLIICTKILIMEENRWKKLCLTVEFLWKNIYLIVVVQILWQAINKSFNFKKLFFRKKELKFFKNTNLCNF